MLRIALVVLALAVYGAYSLVNSLAGDGNQDKVAETSRPVSAVSDLGGAAQMAVSAAVSAAGMSLQPIPAQGCSESMLPSQKVEELVLTLPEPQRTALVTVLNASSNVWTAQLYKGEQGVGLCLPMQEKLVVLPAGVSTAVDQVGAAVAPLQAGITSMQGNP